MPLGRILPPALLIGLLLAIQSPPTRAAGFDPNDPTHSGMVPTFDDEFDQADIAPDGAAAGVKWTNHLWYEKPMAPEVYFTDHGVLKLGVDPKGGFGIATVNAQGQGFAQRFGYFEARLKLPSGKGTWPSFWLLTDDRVTKDATLPASEIDIVEGQGVLSAAYFATLHRDSSAKTDQIDKHNLMEPGVDLSQDFHRYGMLWAPDAPDIVFYFDGRAIGRARKFDTTDRAPMMMILGNGYGDMIGRNQPDLDTPRPSYLLVDYVRVYQFDQNRKPPPEAVSGG